MTWKSSGTALALLALTAALLFSTAAFAQAPDILIAVFEAGSYINRRVEEEAFGLAPAEGYINVDQISDFGPRGGAGTRT